MQWTWLINVIWTQKRLFAIFNYIILWQIRRNEVEYSYFLGCLWIVLFLFVVLFLVFYLFCFCFGGFGFFFFAFFIVFFFWGGGVYVTHGRDSNKLPSNHVSYKVTPHDTIHNNESDILMSSQYQNIWGWILIQLFIISCLFHYITSKL